VVAARRTTRCSVDAHQRSGQIAASCGALASRIKRRQQGGFRIATASQNRRQSREHVARKLRFAGPASLRSNMSALFGHRSPHEWDEQEQPRGYRRKQPEVVKVRERNGLLLSQIG